MGRNSAWILFAICLGWMSTVAAQQPLPSPATMASNCVAVSRLVRNFHVSSHCGYLKPKRVVVVMTHDRQHRLREQTHFAESLTKFLQRENCFEVVLCRQAICQDELPLRKGTFDEHELLALARQFNADAVLYAEVMQLSAYEPMSGQLSVSLVSVSESVALLSAISTIDLRDAVTRNDYLNYSRPTP
ncbi:MAG: hypothetical protein HKN47_00665, partial [Pirellulaceae bacterium]|nr:hypothetical protein [Pirellulaceae bacterium]